MGEKTSCCHMVWTRLQPNMSLRRCEASVLILHTPSVSGLGHLSNTVPGGDGIFVSEQDRRLYNSLQTQARCRIYANWTQKYYAKGLTLSLPVDSLTNQPNIQSTNQLIRQSINYPINQSFNHAINQLTSQPPKRQTMQDISKKRVGGGEGVKMVPLTDCHATVLSYSLEITVPQTNSPPLNDHHMFWSMAAYFTYSHDKLNAQCIVRHSWK